MEQINYLGYELIDKSTSLKATPDISRETIIVGESGSGASFLLKEIVKNKKKVLFITDYKEELDNKFEYKEINESISDDFINVILNFKDIVNPKQLLQDYLNQGYTIAINSKCNDSGYLDFLYSISRLKGDIVAVIRFADDLIENKLFPNDIILMKNETSIFGKFISGFKLGDYVHLQKKIYNGIFKENTGGYKDIQKVEGIGTNFNVILANLGHCLSNTMSDDFYDKVFKIGIDLLDILSVKNDDEKLKKFFDTSFNNSKYIKGGYIQSRYNINNCYIDSLSKMIKSLSTYSTSKENLMTRLFQKNPLIDFYTEYFSILKGSDKYKSSLEDFLTGKIYFLSKKEGL